MWLLTGNLGDTCLIIEESSRKRIYFQGEEKGKKFADIRPGWGIYRCSEVLFTFKEPFQRIQKS
jgi:hypothetical protein